MCPSYSVSKLSECFLIHTLYEGSLFISAVQGGVRTSIWLQVSLISKVFPTGSRTRPPPPCQLDPESSLLYLAGLLDQLPFQESPAPRALLFSFVGDLESDICNAWPLSVSITLWVFIGYQFCVLRLFEDLSGWAWHLFFLCVCRDLVA